MEQDTAPADPRAGNGEQPDTELLQVNEEDQGSELKCEADSATFFSATTLLHDSLLNELTTQLRLTDSSPARFVLTFTRVSDTLGPDDLCELQLSGFVTDPPGSMLACRYAQEELGHISSANCPATISSVAVDIPFQRQEPQRLDPEPQRPALQLFLSHTPWAAKLESFPHTLHQHLHGPV